MAEPLEDVIGRIVDGGPVDWLAEEQFSDPATRALLAQLRIIDQVHESHRTLPDVDAIEPVPLRETPRAPGEADPTSGRRWGKYRLLDSIGEGSFGNVYRALDEQLHRELAIKLLKPGIAARDGFGLRLLREAKDLAKVRHPNVVTIYGVEEHAGQVGLCMEIIEGRTLEAAVRLDGPLNADEAVVVGQAVGRGLAALHHAGLLHRDVKAKNVMRERAGRFVLMDLGASLDTTDPSRMAHARATGTPLYMAPELFEGGASSVQSDVYSLGVLLYFLVTGRHPVEADSYDGLRHAHATGKRVPLVDRRWDLPKAFVKCVDAALGADPRDRFTSTTQMVAAMAGQEPIPASVQPTASQLPLILAGFAAAVIGLGAISTWFFDMTTGRSGYSQDGLGVWFEMGRRSLLPLLVVCLFGVAAVSLLAVIWRLLVASWDTARTADLATKRTVVRIGLHSVATASGAALLVGGTTLLVGWLMSLPMLEQILAIYPDDISTAPAQKMMFLAPESRSLHDTYRWRLEWCVFIAAAVWYPVLRLARRCNQPIDRLIATGGIAVVVLLLALWVLPYRLVYQAEMESATWDGAACNVLGERAGTVLVFCPEKPPPRSVSISAASAGLKRGGQPTELFARIKNAK